MSCSEVEGLGGSGGWFEGDPCGRGLRAGGGGCAWRVRSPSWCRGSRTRGQRTGFGGRIAGASARTSMHLQHRPRLNLISRRMVVGVGRSPAGMDRCVWVNGTLASCASGSSRRCPGQRSLSYGHRAWLRWVRSWFGYQRHRMGRPAVSPSRGRVATACLLRSGPRPISADTPLMGRPPLTTERGTRVVVDQGTAHRLTNMLASGLHFAI